VAPGGGTAIQALVSPATRPLVRRNSIATSNGALDHSGKVISSRLAEPAGKNHVSVPIRDAPNRVVPAGAPPSTTM
jgi:hypothetical protein